MASPQGAVGFRPRTKHAAVKTRVSAPGWIDPDDAPELTEEFSVVIKNEREWTKDLPEAAEGHAFGPVRIGRRKWLTA